MFNSPLPQSSILNPEAMNPYLESKIKQTKHCIPYFFFTRKYFYRVGLLKAKTGGDQFSRNQLFAQLCRPLGVINPHATTHRVEKV